MEAGGLMESPHKGKTGLKRVWNALHYSLAGLRAAFQHEDAFRQEVMLAAILIPLALFLPASGTGHAVMIALGDAGDDCRAIEFRDRGHRGSGLDRESSTRQARKRHR